MLNRISGILLLTLIALGVIIVIQARSGVPSADHLSAARDQSVDTAAAGPVSLSLPPLANLNETTERPLFTESRRPTEDESSDAPVTSTPVVSAPTASFSISAIMITEKERAVLLTHPQSGELTRVAQGETIAGWRLERVESDRAVFSKDGDSKEIALRTFGPPAPARPRRALPAVRDVNSAERAARRAAEAARLRRLDPGEEPVSER